MGKKLYIAFHHNHHLTEGGVLGEKKKKKQVRTDCRYRREYITAYAMACNTTKRLFLRKMNPTATHAVCGLLTVVGTERVRMAGY